MMFTLEFGFCSYDTTNEGARGMFHWNETEVNTIASTTCLYGPNDEVAMRFCVSRDTWAAPSVEHCRTTVSGEFEMIQRHLEQVAYLTNRQTNRQKACGDIS